MRAPASRPGAVHLSASRRGSRAGRGAAQVAVRCHRLRDRDRCRRLAAAADADERGGRTHVDPGRRAVSAAGQRRARRAARRRARCRRRPKWSSSAPESPAPMRSKWPMACEPRSPRSTVRFRACASSTRSSTAPCGRCSRPADAIERAVADADLVIGAVLLPGAAAPKLVTAAMVKRMRPGSVVVDIAIDQGGCFQTSRPTTHAAPTYIVDGVIHYCVTNMPGACRAHRPSRSTTRPCRMRARWRTRAGSAPPPRTGWTLPRGTRGAERRCAARIVAAPMRCAHGPRPRSPTAAA